MGIVKLVLKFLQTMSEANVTDSCGKNCLKEVLKMTLTQLALDPIEIFSYNELRLRAYQEGGK